MEVGLKPPASADPAFFFERVSTRFKAFYRIQELSLERDEGREERSAIYKLKVTHCAYKKLLECDNLL